MRRENNRVFLLAMWMMFFAVSTFGQDSGLLNRYRSRALEYNQDVNRNFLPVPILIIQAIP